jgi:hypothetical protein
VIVEAQQSMNILLALPARRGSGNELPGDRDFRFGRHALPEFAIHFLNPAFQRCRADVAGEDLGALLEEGAVENKKLL